MTIFGSPTPETTEPLVTKAQNHKSTNPERARIAINREWESRMGRVAATSSRD